MRFLFRFTTLSLALVLALAGATGLNAQGVQTGTLVGTVRTSDGVGLPGATVTVTSPALQGERATSTSGNGDYNLPYLPPGQYRVTFSLSGMGTVEEQTTVGLGAPTRLDAEMMLAATAQAITVTAEAPSALETVTIGTNITAETVRDLPVIRTPVGIGSLSVGVSDDRTPVANQLSISGGMAYDNAFLINGVNVQDPIFGSTNLLYIEDAIQETQVLTSGISAEYGHFTGGVLNAITKSGGNEFDGSLRVNFTKPEWRKETPFEEGFRGEGVPPATPRPRTGDLAQTYEATIGGPIVRDALWFFLAGRDQEDTLPYAAPATGINVERLTKNRRLEGKLTATLFDRHTFQGSYIDNATDASHEIQVTPLELAGIGFNSSRPNTGWVVNYNGVLGSNLFGEARYSQKKFGFRNLGGLLTDIRESPIRSGNQGVPYGNAVGTFNAPYFDATDPEDRDNEQMYGALSYFLSTARMGSHELKGGVERFTVSRTGGNSQSATGFVYFTGYANQANSVTPILDASGRMQPRWIPCDGDNFDICTFIANYIPVRGAISDTTTDSIYLNDRWDITPQWSVMLGVRHEIVNSEATGEIVSIDTETTVPRLGVSFDPGANGRFKVDVTYAEYSGRYNPAITAANSPVGNPAGLYGYYVGPEGTGRDFAAGFDPSNYIFYDASVPTANVFMEEGLSSPVNREMTFGVGMQLARNSFVKVAYVDRELTQMIEDFITVDQGCTDVALEGVDVGCVDNRWFRNSDVPERVYQAGEIQGRYNLTRNWLIEGNWTHQFKNDGNYEGEGGQGFGATPLFDRPEIQTPRSFVTGRLAQFQEDRVRLWTTYNLDLGRAGNLGAGVVYRFDSGRTFSFFSSTAFTSIQRARNPGYQSIPSSQTIFFGERGAGQFEDSSLFDVSLNYGIPIFRAVEPWIKVDVRNVLNDDTLISHNTGIVFDASSPLDENGIRTGFRPGSAFGRPTGAASYVIPREILVSAGIRF